MSSRRFLLRRVWHLAIPTPPAMGYSPTEYAEFTEPPTEMSSHGFLLRRVWHLAIPTPPAMGYSPTEYAEFTEPPTEMSSHGFHRFTQILMVRCSPTEFTEYTEFGSVGMAGMPYPPTSVLIRAICGSPFSARGSVYSVYSVGISFLPRISQIYTDTYGALFSHRIHRIHRIWQRGYGRDAIPSYICAHPCSSVGGSSLPEVSVRSVRSVGISFLPRISQIYTDT